MLLKNLSIRKKLLFSFLTLIFFALSGSLLTFILFSKINKYHQTKSEVGEIVRLLTEARKVEKDFMLYDRKMVHFLESGKSESIDNHRLIIDSINSILDKSKKSELIKSAGLAFDIHLLSLSVNNYQMAFHELTEIMFKRGFRNHGLEVEMRKHVHELQESASAEEREIAYMMRRHEKDFILRNDLKYQKELHEKVERYLALLDTAKFDHLTADYVKENKQRLFAYKAAFDRLVEMEKVIGLTENQGLNKKLKVSAASVEPFVNQLYETIQSESERQFNNALLLLLLSVFVLIPLSILLSVFLNKYVTKPILLLDKITEDIVVNNDYEMGEKLKEINTNDELGSLANHFSMMLSKVVEQIVLVEGKNKRLEESAKEEEIRSWHVEGLAHFSDIMKISNTTLDEMANMIIAELVKYTNCNQGLFFIKEEKSGEAFMQLKACYAYNKKKYVNIQVSLGEGLTGQAWQERDTIFITDVPDDFIKITSGLGNANPRCILIVPIKSEQEVEGVIELAAFHVLERHEIQFVQELADKLASIVHAVKMQETTNNLLENAQQITEELRAQEEEMRQNMEELQATQEEMHRNSAELNKEVVRLGQNLFLYDKVISKVYEGIIILNEKLEITYANEFVSGILKYDKSELIGEHVNQFINADVEKIVNFLANDPGYIVTGFSEKKEVFLMEKLGDSIKAKMVLTKFMGLDNEASVVFLINTKTEDKSRKRLQLMIGRS